MNNEFRDMRKKIMYQRVKSGLFTSPAKDPSVAKKISLGKLGRKNPMYGKTGPLHPNWQGGKSFEPYALGWTKTFKEQIRYRDGYKCQICGIPETECMVKLSVHHIDYDKKNLDLINLISLCRICHTRTNFNREYWREFFNGN